MAFPQGINFRATAGFVTDTGDSTYEIGTTANYPRTTPQGNVVGWEQAITGTRDRVLLDARLAGVHYLTSSTASYRIDLPTAGVYDVFLAAGDAANPSYCKLELFDNATSKGVLVNRGAVQIPLGAFVDATGVERADYPAWVANNLPVRVTFASTIARFRLDASGGNPAFIAHLRMVPVAGGGGDASAPGATLTATSSIAGGAATTNSVGTLTTHIVWNNTRTPMANETGVVLNIYDVSTGALVVRKSGVTTNSAGVAVVTDALIAAGTSYAYEVVLTGARRRLPVKAAT